MRQVHFIAIGANLPVNSLGKPEATCMWAAGAVPAAAGLVQACRSRWFSSAPLPASDQPRYINGVLRVEGEIAPDRLLAVLQTLERQAGRVRGVPDAARTLDLDIVDMNGLVRDAPDPVLPHPRTHLRAFVLLPLRDVAPDWVHPRTGQGIGALVAGLPKQDIHPL